MASFSKTARNVLQMSPNDVVLLSAVRSPINRSFKGGFKDAYPEDILMPVSLGRGVRCIVAEHDRLWRPQYTELV
jgi:acetyl-CoA acyltransferase 1